MSRTLAGAGGGFDVGIAVGDFEITAPEAARWDHFPAPRSPWKGGRTRGRVLPESPADFMRLEPGKRGFAVHGIIGTDICRHCLDVIVRNVMFEFACRDQRRPADSGAPP